MCANRAIAPLERNSDPWRSRYRSAEWPVLCITDSACTGIYRLGQLGRLRRLGRGRIGPSNRKIAAMLKTITPKGRACATTRRSSVDNVRHVHTMSPQERGFERTRSYDSDAMDTPVPDTSTTLLHDVSRDPESPRWEELVGRYRPVVHYYVAILRASNPGLSADRAHELENDSLTEIASALRQGRFDRSQGRFRQFVFGIVRNQMRKAFESAAKETSENPFLLDTAPYASDARDDEAEAERLELEREVTRLLIGRVFDDGRFSGQSKAIFLKLVGEEASVDELSASYGVPANAIYQLKKRVIDRIRDLRAAMTPPGGDLVDLLEVLLGQP